MDGSRHPRVSDAAAALAVPARARMALALMDGRAWTVGELARAAGVASNTGSDHVDRLVAADIAVDHRQGRHRYVALAGPESAEALEALCLIAPVDPPAPSLRTRRADAELVAGRTCYRHLAGRLGVDLAAGWRRHRLVDDAWALTGVGREWLDGIGLAPPPAPDRAPLRPCIDWTERVPHAAGPVADAFADLAWRRGWLRRGRHRRSAALTDAGRAALADVLDGEGALSAPWTPRP